MIANAEAFYEFIVEREEIRLRKEAGLSPLTVDPILRDYKFTNVRRENDRTSLAFAKFYREHVPGSKWDIVLLNCGIARYFGTSEFLLSLGWQEGFDPDFIIDHAKRRMTAGLRVFTGAYVITNQGISAPKQEVVVNHFLAPLWKNSERLATTVVNRDSWEHFVGELMGLNGFGGTGFMAKEVTLDFIMATGWKPADFNTWSPSGPGARRGAARVTGADNLKLYMGNPAATLKIMQELYALRDEFWPRKFVPLRLTDIQFQLCEFDKYERTRLGQGRPRSRYRGTRQ